VEPGTYEVAGVLRIGGERLGSAALANIGS
jgi:hypothetical protein